MLIDTVDVVVVGGGHNGLICAAYLARAGVSVAVVERNDVAGGSMFSTTVGETRLDLGAVEHTSVLTTGVIDDLDLTGAGLAYSTRDIAGVHLFGDGTRVEIGATAEQTAASIAAVDARDAESWLRLVELSAPLMTVIGAAGRAASDRLMPSMTLLDRLAQITLPKSSAELRRLANDSVVELADRWFRSPYMRALAISRSGFAGLPPTQPGTGAVFCFTTGGYGRTFGRPVGGSAAFVDAVVRRLTEAGGAVYTGFDVAEIERAGGRWSVRADDDRRVVARRAVVSAIPPQTTLLRLLQPTGLVPDVVRTRLQHVEVDIDNVSQLTLTAILAGLPPSPVSDDYMASTLWLMPDPGDAMRAYASTKAKRLPDSIGTLLVFPTLMDPSLAPAGTHTMWANSFVGVELDGGWDAHRAACADLVWRTIESCVPGTRERTTFERLTVPIDLETRTAARNPGNHVAPIPAQMLRNRPVRGLGRRTPIDGLYLTAAGTHPGGGVSGDAGRRTAQVVLADLQQTVLARGAAGVATTARQLTSGLKAWHQVRTVKDVHPPPK